jgi:hypothetical protein
MFSRVALNIETADPSRTLACLYQSSTLHIQKNSDANIQRCENLIPQAEMCIS